MLIIPDLILGIGFAAISFGLWSIYHEQSPGTLASAKNSWKQVITLNLIIFGCLLFRFFVYLGMSIFLLTPAFDHLSLTVSFLILFFFFLVLLFFLKASSSYISSSFFYLENYL